MYAIRSYYVAYQITQLHNAIVQNGELHIDLEDGTQKRVGITQAHLEADAGKNMHEGDHSKVDLNRAGTPLLEIVSAPDMRSSDEAVAYLKKLHATVRYLDISDANMQEGRITSYNVCYTKLLRISSLLPLASSSPLRITYALSQMPSVSRTL